jgi:hypothetical protein
MANGQIERDYKKFGFQPLRGDKSVAGCIPIRDGAGLGY